MISQILQDAFFSAIAAIGFAAISHPPRRAFIWCALIAAIGHSIRFILMRPETIHMHIVPASLIASFAIGLCAVLASSKAKFPAETCLFPALLPMIPGIYAYKAFGGLVLCLISDNQSSFSYDLYLFISNALTCSAILLCMVVGATSPIFILKKIAFQATR